MNNSTITGTRLGSVGTGVAGVSDNNRPQSGSTSSKAVFIIDEAKQHYSGIIAELFC
ncbi:hypothetical protein MTP16_01085 [Hymenobacter monticola]|uniref:Uncharacterized protein n=1 Tax=Hymenobacter monticola TaxID=1705399 RepID=A0ABY4B5G4_9BACT|nr:hypothetical protein [Hymenobacter monticola]UOE34260.1 hypothetical protein MTP16_01085 [Hymenobacter monticola]